VTTWMNLEDMIIEMSQSQKDKYLMIPLICGTQGSQIHTECKMVVARIRGREIQKVIFLKGMEFHFGIMKNFRR
jgi:hypothetical protein